MRFKNIFKKGLDSLQNIRGAAADVLFMLRYLFRKNPFLTVFSMFAFALVGIVPLTISFLYKLLIDEIGRGASDGLHAGWLIWILLWYILTPIIGEALGHLKEYVNLKLGLRMSHSFHLMYLGRLQEIDVEWLDDPDFYDLVSRSRADVNQHPEKLLFKCIEIFENLISFLAYLAVIIGYSPYFLLLCVASLLVTSLRYKKTKEKQFLWRQSVTLSQRRVSYYDDVQLKSEFIPENRLYGLQAFWESRYQKSRKELLENELKLEKEERFERTVDAILRQSVELCIQLYLAALVLLGKVSLGDYTLLLASVGGLIRDGRWCFSSLVDTYVLSKDIHYLRTFLTAEHSSIIKHTAGRRIQRNGGKHRFEFRHVSFRYRGAQKNALSDVSFVIEPGETVTLVGENGSGKSTIMKLLLRLYDPTEGEIYVDGVDLREYDALDYYSVIGAMFQKNINYCATVEESVWFGNTKRSLEDSGGMIDDALAFADLSETVRGLKNGRKTATTNQFEGDSFEPSGGELQKLSLARARFRDSEFMVLDEPSSALDAISEKNIFERIYVLKDGVTTLMITHRLNHINMSNRIIVLKEGRIEETGTHEELCRAKGSYYEMYTKQSSHYVQQS